ncbi:uncharacterized protein PRCAT00002635001 [Priceomyces carsonii]|uniref:uncharacterized protein n=1 Tax=Priceomyces carsonii TaxID=28549 RepID=UPI002EDA5B0F|nr:unnamed protein product [Priceomyces carsonii]
MSHNHNLSINSLNSIIEPTTPPNLISGRSGLWDSNKLSGNLSLPNFSLELGTAASQSVRPTAAALATITACNGNTSNGLVNGGNINANSLAPSMAVPSSSQLHINHPSHSRQILMDSIYDNKENIGGVQNSKIDKEYLASISKVPLQQISLDILQLSKDQYGCRFLQKKIDENLIPNKASRQANFEVIFKEIYPYMYELIIDPFGNYLIQKLISYCDEANLNLMLKILQYNLFQISINQHGTRALQKLIDSLNNNLQLELLTKGLQPYIIELIKDLNGNHVIQKILNKYLPEDCQFIYDSIINDLLTVATHKHGCCVLQKCLNHVTPNQLLSFSNKILSFEVFVKLINDQFGNYVLQYLISINSFEINLKMFNNFIAFGINNLCNLKFSSNVIEKFLKNCYNNEFRSEQFSNLKFSLVYQILITDLNKLINDPYGNYVIQTLIDVLINSKVGYKEPFLNSFLKLLPLNYKTLQDTLQIIIIKNWFKNCKIVSSFGKRIQLKINLILNGVPQQQFHSSPYYAPKNRSQNMISPQNMNAQGEFVNSDSQMMPPMQYRSLSFSSPSQGQQSNYPLALNYYLQLPNNYILGSGSQIETRRLNQVNNQAMRTNTGLNNDLMTNDYQMPLRLNPGQAYQNQQQVYSNPKQSSNSAINSSYMVSTNRFPPNQPSFALNFPLVTPLQPQQQNQQNQRTYAKENSYFQN